MRPCFVNYFQTHILHIPGPFRIPQAPNAKKKCRADKIIGGTNELGFSLLRYPWATPTLRFQKSVSRNAPRMNFPKIQGKTNPNMFQKRHYGVATILNYKTSRTAEPKEWEVTAMPQLDPQFTRHVPLSQDNRHSHSPSL